jgi:chemotaxis protein methyltransferase WspC
MTHLKHTDPIHAFLFDRLGLDADSIGISMIANAIETRMSARGVTGRESYAQIIASDDDECAQLTELLVVPETWFFRDNEPFEFLKRHARECIASGRTIRILSIPCSTGEEPYSIAIALREAGIARSSFHIDAYDISEKALAQARKGVYSAPSFREPLTASQARFFSGDIEAMRVADSLRDNISFEKANIIDPHFNPSGTYDAIFCRNLIIYLNDGARRKITDLVCRLLSPTGVLLTGHAEIMFFIERGFEAVEHQRSFACRRRTESNRKQPVHMITANHTGRRRAVPAAIPAPHAHHARAKHDDQAVRLAEPAAVDTLHEIMLMANSGAYEDALRVCMEHLRRHSDSDAGWCLRGTIEEGLHLTEDALESYGKALYLNPDNEEALAHVSLIYEQRGNIARARALRARAERIHRPAAGNGGNGNGV